MLEKGLKIALSETVQAMEQAVSRFFIKRLNDACLITFTIDESNMGCNKQQWARVFK